MITEAKFKHALIEMMQEKPLEDINVTSLCDRCGCHRQTFYYHYQDIYDLIAAIFLNEDVEQIEKATNPNDLLGAVLEFCASNFTFLKATYDSAAQDLSEQFFYNKIMTRLFSILDKNVNDDVNVYRLASRRFAKIISDEIGYSFKDKDLTIDKFEKKISPFFTNAIDMILPVLIDVARKESK